MSACLPQAGQYQGQDPDPVINEGDSPGSSWTEVLNEYYVRDVNGKEIAIYQNGNLTQWNMWGLDNFGKINSDGSLFFYLKDHLGSIHAVVNQSNMLVSAQDYDAWGYIMPERQWQQDPNNDEEVYKFTSKERDNESNYDYGACPALDAGVRDIMIAG